MDQSTPDFAVPKPPPPPSPRLPFRTPAEYYASPERSPVLPRIVPFGCGGAAIIFIVMLFGAGMMVDRFMPQIFAMLQKEMAGQFTKDVTPAQRADFNREFDQLRARLQQHRTNLNSLRPFLEKMRDATMDDRITPEETRTLTEAMRKANGR